MAYLPAVRVTAMTDFPLLVNRLCVCVCVCVCVCSVASVLSDSVIPWTVAHQAALSVEFARQEY